MAKMALDLCCGLGGWAEGLRAAGWFVVGIDCVDQPSYPGEFIQRDIREVKGSAFEGFDLVVASPPCEEFSRHGMPWTRQRNPPEPDLSLVEACWRIAREAKAPIVLENVRSAQKWLGKSEWRWGSCYLWGDGIPCLRPERVPRSNGKAKLWSSARARRAKIPFLLSYWIGVMHGIGEPNDG